MKSAHAGSIATTKGRQLRTRFALSLALALSPHLGLAQTTGHAAGSGSILSMPEQPSHKEQRVAFAPKYAVAYIEGSGKTAETWIVLTEKAPPAASWAAANDRRGAWQTWCQREKTGFVAVRLDADNDADLFLCPPGAAASNTEMTSTANGLKSIEVNFITRTAKRVTGTLRGGVGNCPKADGKNAYCIQHSDYSFDATVTR